MAVSIFPSLSSAFELAPKVIYQLINKLAAGLRISPYIILPLFGLLAVGFLFGLGLAFPPDRMPSSENKTSRPWLAETKVTVTPMRRAVVIMDTRSAGEARSDYNSSESQVVFMPVIMHVFVTTPCTKSDLLDDGIIVGDNRPVENIESVVSGGLVKWHPVTVSFQGPMAAETDEDPNPFLDYRLQVLFIGPSGQYYVVPGFFNGDGAGNGNGNLWQARFAPDESGQWRFCASFRVGPNVAVDLDPQAGEPGVFDGTGGVFDVTEHDVNAPGFLKWGRLEYVGEHYLKFADGPYWIKGGTNSPENFLGYNGFDNTVDQGGIIPEFLHSYTPHVADWQEGDPYFISADAGNDSRGIIGALNYLSNQHVNSIYFLPMNLGGDGQETYPFITPGGSFFDNTHFDISKLHQWNIVLDHAQQRGIALHIVLNETELDNRTWLDDGRLGVERKLFYREMIARFGYLLALKWNLSEEVVFTKDELAQFADYIQMLDWAKHPTTIHNPSDWFHPYEELLGDTRFTITAIQYEGEQAGQLVETWRKASAETGLRWVVDMDENNPAGIGLSPDNADQLRRQILYDVYFSGGNIEWYSGYYDLPLGGDVNLEDFRSRRTMWEYMWYARSFMEDNLPFWAMEPADHLLIGESDMYGGGEVFALGSIIYAVYLPNASPTATLLVEDISGEYLLRWYDPRSGQFVGGAMSVVVTTEGELPLGEPPNHPDADWVLLITSTIDPLPTTIPIAYP